MKKRLLAILLAAAFMLPTFVAVFAEDWQWTWEDELSYSCNEIISGVYLQNDTAGSTGEIGDAFDKSPDTFWQYDGTLGVDDFVSVCIEFDRPFEFGSFGIYGSDDTDWSKYGFAVYGQTEEGDWEFIETETYGVSCFDDNYSHVIVSTPEPEYGEDEEYEESEETEDYGEDYEDEFAGYTAIRLDISGAAGDTAAPAICEITVYGGYTPDETEVTWDDLLRPCHSDEAAVSCLSDELAEGAEMSGVTDHSIETYWQVAGTVSDENPATLIFEWDDVSFIYGLELYGRADTMVAEGGYKFWYLDENGEWVQIDHVETYIYDTFDEAVSELDAYFAFEEEDSGIVTTAIRIDLTECVDAAQAPVVYEVRIFGDYDRPDDPYNPYNPYDPEIPDFSNLDIAEILESLGISDLSNLASYELIIGGAKLSSDGEDVRGSDIDNIADGDLGTYWQVEELPAQLVLTWGDPAAIDGLYMFVGNSTLFDEFANGGFTVSYLDEKGEWVQIEDVNELRIDTNPILSVMLSLMGVDDFMIMALGLEPVDLSGLLDGIDLSALFGALEGYGYEDGEYEEYLAPSDDGEDYEAGYPEEFDLTELLAGLDLTELLAGFDLSELLAGADLTELLSGLDFGELAGDADLSELFGGIDLSEYFDENGNFVITPEMMETIINLINKTAVTIFFNEVETTSLKIEFAADADRQAPRIYEADVIGVAGGETEPDDGIGKDVDVVPGGVESVAVWAMLLLICAAALIAVRKVKA